MDGRGDPPMSSRHSNLKKSFKLGIRSLLTAFSKEDVEKAFPTITNSERESLYLMFVQVLKSLHENIEEEFESICQETEVGKTLDIIEQLVEEHNLDVLAADKTDIGGITEKILKAKKDEIQDLTSLLQKVDDYNNVMKARIESLKTSQDLSTADIVEQLRSWNGNFEKYHGSLNG
ncbi:uncharacterized protein LOC135633029 [Musa acuminata AAA Group]|uniref:(wild Malaysian banana) hypothetical protein n=1 Tax=Musa acuminata subsp. malaccensis TaxID=214687 RepID=A0A804IHG2_MUSAM|nr:PREDICTED: uncharacterized protein LOC103978642 [Musa acuminata subsp. malaccensis]CAG1851571.1 unnamed protein product [Musa acuminata subsp. malaccensis]